MPTAQPQRCGRADMRTERALERRAVLEDNCRYCACCQSRRRELAVVTLGGNGRRCDDHDQCVCGVISAFSTTTKFFTTEYDELCTRQNSADVNRGKKMTENGREKADVLYAARHPQCNKFVETAFDMNDFPLRLCSQTAATFAKSEMVEERKFEARADGGGVGSHVETSTRMMQDMLDSHVPAADDQPPK